MLISLHLLPMNAFSNTELSARLATVAVAVLLLLLLWAAVRLLWQLVDGPEVPAVEMPPVPRAHSGGFATYDERWELFGRDHRAPLVVPRQVDTSPLALRLRGVVASGENGGYAVIADEGGRELVYRPGDELAGNAVLEAVEPRRVLIRRDGKIEALELPRQGAGSSGSGSARPASGPPAAVSAIPGIRGMGGDNVQRAAAGFGIDSSDLAGAISIMPVRGGGFRVRPGRDATIFRQLGLQADDVITAVNGQPVQSEQDARRIFDEVMSTGELAITVRREGRQQVLRPDLRGF